MRSKLAVSDVSRVRAIQAELAVIHLDARSAVNSVLPEIRQLVQTETLLVLCPALRATGWGIGRYHDDNFSNATRFKQLVSRFLATAPRRYAWYDAVRPEPDQRNRVLDPFDIIPPGEFEASEIYQQVLLPMRLHQHRQPRVLLCDGASLLAWFGAFHAGPIDHRQLELLAAVAPAMRSRLAIERRLQTSPRDMAALEAALEQLGVPALVIGASGHIFDANTAAYALLATRGAEVHGALLDALAGRASTLGFALVSLAERGSPGSWLATLRTNSAEAQIAACLAKVTQRWQLTRRQCQVLGQIVDGQANTTIAATAGTTERAVELHVTALFDRAGVDSRSALVARVLVS